MNDKTTKTFTIKVEEIFYFSDGSTVFAGPITEGDDVTTPCDASVLLDGKEISKICLHGERMPGPNLPENYRIFFTRDTFSVDKSTEKSHVLLLQGKLIKI